MKKTLIVLLLLISGCSSLSDNQRMIIIQGVQLKWINGRIELYKAMNIIAGAKGVVEWEFSDSGIKGTFQADGHVIKSNFQEFRITIIVSNTNGECELIGYDDESKFNKMMELTSEMAKSSIQY